MQKKMALFQCDNVLKCRICVSLRPLRLVHVANWREAAVLRLPTAPDGISWFVFKDLVHFDQNTGLTVAGKLPTLAAGPKVGATEALYRG